jgi:hypothetical protein
MYMGMYISLQVLSRIFGNKLAMQQGFSKIDRLTLKRQKE